MENPESQKSTHFASTCCLLTPLLGAAGLLTVFNLYGGASFNNGDWIIPVLAAVIGVPVLLTLCFAFAVWAWVRREPYRIAAMGLALGLPAVGSLVIGWMPWLWIGPMIAGALLVLLTPVRLSSK